MDSFAHSSGWCRVENLCRSRRTEVPSLRRRNRTLLRGRGRSVVPEEEKLIHGMTERRRRSVPHLEF